MSPTLRSAIRSDALLPSLALVLILLLAAVLYAPSFGNYFVQDDFVGLSMGRAVASNPAALFNPAPGEFPPGYRTGQIAWWTLGWWIGGGTPAVFHAGQALVLAGILAGIFIIARQLGLSVLGAVLAMWFFLLMPLLTESFYWLAATPLHLVFSLAGVACFIAWLGGAGGHAALVAALALAFLSCETKEAGLWAFMVIVAAAALLPGRRGVRARAWASGLAIAGALLYVALYLLLPYAYPSGAKGLPGILASHGRLVVQGWTQPVVAVKKAALQAGLSAGATRLLDVGAGALLLVLLGLAAARIWKRPARSEIMRRVAFTVLAGLAAALPYSLSGVSGWRYVTDIGVWVALSWGLLADPFVARRRVALGLVTLCAVFSLITIVATRQIRSTYDWLGRTTYMLCAEIEGNADAVDRYLVVGFPETGGYLRVWHVPKLIRLCDPSVADVAIGEEVPDRIEEREAVILYSPRSMPDRFYRWISPRQAETQDGSPSGP